MSISITGRLYLYFIQRTRCKKMINFLICHFEIIPVFVTSLGTSVSGDAPERCSKIWLESKASEKSAGLWMIYTEFWWNFFCLENQNPKLNLRRLQRGYVKNTDFIANRPPSHQIGGFMAAYWKKGVSFRKIHQPLKHDDIGLQLATSKRRRIPICLRQSRVQTCCI